MRFNKKPFYNILVALLIAGSPRFKAEIMKGVRVGMEGIYYDTGSIGGSGGSSAASLNSGAFAPV